MARKLYLLRHGSTGADGRFIGSTDLPLSEEGKKQIKAVRPVFGHDEIDILLCSPMTRCIQSIELLETQKPHEIVNELREIDFGLWENLDFESVNSKYPDHVSEWMENPETFTFPQGEWVPDFIKRLEKVKKRIEEESAENILAVCHGGVIRYMICLFLHLPLSSAMLFNASPGCCTCIDIFDRGGVLTGFNLRGKYHGNF
jgi:alpha-ribazole phosphatase